MAYTNSKKYGSAVQHYKKVNGDISFYVTYKDENSKLKRVKIGEKSKGITEHFCNAKRNEILNSIRLGTQSPIKSKKKKATLFDVVAQKYLDSLQLHSNQRTIKGLKNTYTLHLKRLLGDRAVDTITIDDLEALQKKKIKTLSAKSVNQIVDLFSTIFTYGMKKDLIHVLNPAIKVKRFKIDNTRERFLAIEEINELLTLLRDKELLYLFTKIALCTGGRMETLLHIQKKDIDLRSSIITLKDLKNNSTYRSFLTSDIIDILKVRFKVLRADDYVISTDSKKITSRQIQSRLKPIIDKLFNSELEKDDRKNRVVIHTLRHTFASHLAINGTPIFTIQKLMNHRDIKQTLRYAKLSPNSGKEYIQSLYS